MIGGGFLIGMVVQEPTPVALRLGVPAEREKHLETICGSELAHKVLIGENNERVDLCKLRERLYILNILFKIYPTSDIEKVFDECNEKKECNFEDLERAVRKSIKI